MLSDAVFRPMLFSTPMVQALLNGTKTQTRRLVNGNIPIGNFDETLKKSVLKIGSIIWVRETFNTNYNDTGFIYKADYKVPAKNKHFWKPSLFMPKTACRIFLEVTDIRIERLNEISESDSIEEGIEYSTEFGYKLYSKNSFFSKHLSASDSYMSLWELINGQGSWKENPFVWVYTFKVVECPYGFR
jgi:hypothetical protein